MASDAAASAPEAPSRDSLTVVNSGIEQTPSVAAATEQMTRAEVDDTAKEPDSVVEAVRVELAEPGVAVIGEVEGVDDSESGGATAAEEVVVDESLPLENKFVEIAADGDDGETGIVADDEPGGLAGVDDHTESRTDAEVEQNPVHNDDDEKAEEDETVKESDSVVEAVHVELQEPGVAVVGEVESETGPVAVVDESVSLENEFVKIAEDSEELAQLEKTLGEGTIIFPKTAELPDEEESVVEAVRVVLPEPGVAVVGELEESDEKSVALAMEEKVVESLPVDNNMFDKISGVSEDLAELDVNQNMKPGNGGNPDDAVEMKHDVEGSVEEQVEVVTEAEEDISGETSRSKEEMETPELVDGGSDETPVAVASSDRSVPNVSNEVSGKSGFGQLAEEVRLDDDNEKKKEEEEEEEEDDDDDDENDDYDDDEGEGKAEASDEEMIFGSSEAAKQFLDQLKQEAGSLQDGQIVTESSSEDEEVETDEDEDGEGKEGELFDPAALAALLKAAAASGGGTTTSNTGDHTVTVTSQDGSQRLFSLERPAGLGSSLRAMRAGAPATRPPPGNRPSLFAPATRERELNDDDLSEEDKEKLENLQQMLIKYLRLVFRLGYSINESIVSQVLYRLNLVAGKQSSRLFNVESAKTSALQLESDLDGKSEDDLGFFLNILVLGKSGVGKSSTVNALLGEEKSSIDAFESGTGSVKEINSIVKGMKIRVIDTPGLKSSGSEQATNRRILTSAKRYMRKCPPDIVLYVDRLDTQTRDLNDLLLLKSITTHLGSSIWRNAIVTLTHAASAPPDGPSGVPLSYEVFVAQRSHVLQQSIGQAVGDLRLMNPSLMNPVSLVENHSSCRKNRDGEKVLPNGQSWRPQLLLLCSSMKVLSEATAISKPAQESFDPRKLFARSRSPPLPYMLSWLLQSRPHPKLATDESGVDSDVELGEFSDSDREDDEEDEYDQLPPFKPLRKAQLAKLSKEQKKAYLEEYDYRVKLLQKKQLKEELRRIKEMKKGKKNTVPDDYDAENGENGDPAAVQVPLPDMALPPSFDSDNPVYRYRFLEPNSQMLIRPVLDTHGWDHDPGYDGVNVENSFAIVDRFPAAVTVQVTKDKKDFNLHLDSSVAAKYGETGSTMAGFDIQNVGKQLAYVVRGETKFRNLNRNRTAAGVSVTFLGQNVATGLKLEDQIMLGKRLMLVGSTGAVKSQGDLAYGANLEVKLRDADFPIGQDQSSLGLSLVKWRGDLALAANLQSQFSVGRSSKIAVRAGLNNKLSGQLSVRMSNTDQLQIAVVGLLPIVMAIYKSIRPPPADESYSLY